MRLSLAKVLLVLYTVFQSSTVHRTGQNVCVMMFDEYADLKEQDGGKLFMVPERIESNFLAAKEEGCQMSLNGL